MAGDLDLSPPPPPTRAPRLVSLQSTKPSQLPPSPRRRRPPCPDRRGARTPTRCRIPCPCRTVCPLPPPAHRRRPRPPSWGRVEIQQEQRVASSSSRAGEYPRPAWMEWDGMEWILSLCWLVLFFFSIRIQAFPSLDSSRRGFRLLHGNLGQRIFVIELFL